MKPITTWLGCRVSKVPTFYPAYEKQDGHGGTIKVSERLVVPFMHVQQGYETSNGRRVDDSIVSGQFTAWGILANSYAKLFSLGMEFSCLSEIGQYKVPYRRQGQIMQAPDGAELMVNQINHTIIAGCMWLGKESRKFAEEEILHGKRPLGYDGYVSVAMLSAAEAQGAQALADFCQRARQGIDLYKQARAALPDKWAPGMAVFGYAVVDASRASGGSAYSPAGGATAEVGGVNVSYAMLTSPGENQWSPKQVYDFEGGRLRHLIPADVLATLIERPAPPANMSAAGGAASAGIVPPPPGNTI